MAYHLKGLQPHVQEFGKTKIYIIVQDDRDDLSKEVRMHLPCTGGRS